ncbi:DNA repair helicase [Daedalea quercina L-15889]|uniref:ATP-dependent DNA helicase CHL1 n=1 Tax=Daedalea quercina L-15889 TaxID=1314783 RepID=A0A165SSY8_9APHY|nr:DNA repair helicase [Daedalea quercina L-15889]
MSLKLNTPSSFPAFPFKPYGIQLDFMQHLYAAIEDRKVTIIESPTGTGKTLSLLCGSLTWLKDEQDRARKGQLDALSTTTDGPDWVLQQTLERRRRELEAEDRDHAERLAKARKKEVEMRKMARAHVRKKQVSVRHLTSLYFPVAVQGEDDRDFLPDDTEEVRSDDEYSNLSPAVRALMQKLQRGSRLGTDEENEPVCTKIYYASRTHSQLAQVLHELRKLRINSSKRPLAEESNTGDADVQSNSVRTVSLASRKQLCINEALQRRPGDIDEACRQLLGEKGKRRCPHLPPVDEEAQMLDLRDQILATPKDIEDLVEAGQNADVCPYFGSRKAIPQAQLVLLPYNLLLQKNAREALGVDLANQVVVIDEAHNLISTLLSLSTTRLPVRTLSAARQQLSVYLSRFRTRLSTNHALHLTRLMGLLDALQRYADEWRKAQGEALDKGQGVEVMTPGELLQRLGRKSESVNLLEVENYLRSSRIARKISGYAVKALEKAAGEVARLVTTTPPLHAVESLITSLTSANDDGRVTLAVVEGQVEIKYQQLNPATHFQDIIDTARSVILAGGTMSPISDVVQQLFTKVSSERLTTFSCGHIVAPTSLQTLVLKKGPRGAELQFKFAQRNDTQSVTELGQILLNLVNVVPAGMVVFLPSYSFLNVVMAQWQKSGLVAKLNGKKKVFSEPQSAGDVETVLREYSAATRTDSTGEGPRKGGALLFAVIGAKLSEGLNFTDDLARAVVIIGLPYANLASPELQERMKYVNRLQRQAAGANPPTKQTNTCKDAATELYENMCMNAVNQSIGRAIRHQNDWAALVLVDCRYGSSRIRGKLPQWIAKNAVITDTFGQAMKALGSFYRSRRGNSEKYCTMDPV